MRILFSPYGGGSIAHIVRSFSIADKLKARGHDILFTGPTIKREMIEKAGYSFYGKGHASVNLNDENEQGVSYFRNNQAAFLDWLQDEINAAKDFAPDIIVNSPTFFGPHVQTLLGIPHISVVNATFITEFKGLLGLGKISDSPSHRLTRALAKPIFSRQFEAVYLKEIQTFYRLLGIENPPLKRAELHRSTPILIPGIPEFEPIELTKRTDIHYVGPLFWDGFEQQEFNGKELFSDFDKKPFIYVSLGGSVYRQKSYDDLIAALAKRTEWNILLSLGPNFPRDYFVEDYKHLAIRPFVPGLKVCEQADLIINTGSHGTVMQALWHGKPVIALPHNIDQGTLAAHLTELGIGVNLNRLGMQDFSHLEKYFQKATEIPWHTVVKATEEALANAPLRKRAQDFKRHLQAYPAGGDIAADWVEHYAAKRQR